jgi:hypothetical protein
LLQNDDVSFPILHIREAGQRVTMDWTKFDAGEGQLFDHGASAVQLAYAFRWIRARVAVAQLSPNDTKAKLGCPFANFRLENLNHRQSEVICGRHPEPLFDVGNRVRDFCEASGGLGPQRFEMFGIDLLVERFLGLPLPLNPR